MEVGTEPVRWGFVSLAQINDRVLPEIADSPAIDLIAIASRSDEAAARYAGERGIPRHYGSYDALLTDPDVEAVYIPLPNSMHVEWTLRALEAGKHVLCEKPMGRRADEVRAAFDVAERLGLTLMEGFMWRHHPQTRRAAELVAGGAIGELRLVRATFGFTLEDLANVRMLADLDGGALMDVGCYCVSGTRLFAGEPETAIGRQVLGPSGVDVRFASTMAFPGDVLAHFDCGFDAPDHSILEVVGSRATLRIPTPFLTTEPGLELEQDGRTERIEIPAAPNYRLQFENLSAAIRGAAEPLLGRDDAVGQALTIEALYRSADRGGEPVAVTPG
jgi:D-xylose 1-dehydrogenase (NADP+, D-xylono-1,5-lactone-forming)